MDIDRTHFDYLNPMLMGLLGIFLFFPPFFCPKSFFFLFFVSVLNITKQISYSILKNYHNQTSFHFQLKKIMVLNNSINFGQQKFALLLLK